MYALVTFSVLAYSCIVQGLTSEIKKEKISPHIDVLKKQCCPRRNSMYIDLTNGKVWGGAEGVSQPVFTPQSNIEECGVMADLRANFQNLTNCLQDWHKDGCVDFPMCGRRMLRIDMYLGKERGGYMFNVGDSPSNDGWGGDGSDTKHDAELMGLYSHIWEFKSDYCKTEKTEWKNTLLAPNVSKVTIFVANNYVRILNDQGFEVKGCHKCLFALNGQDPEDRANTLYMAFNNMIRGTHRRGYGVCRVSIRWECPDCERSLQFPINPSIKGGV
ncbi:uncharacterized protein LOC133181529 [Saccostrea echinata]|uniref:uncharacterized protein LOC133181529 n=1 Tax=Saccostrea echinata TaxID=191078 RepID=UPI002A805085|nr:uncharacterized protein LOC133181529 [Saccostrea echinata]